MTKRIPPSTQMMQALSEVFRGKGETAVHPLDELVRQGARYMLQVGLEEEVSEFLGRGHYSRGERRRGGWRNGYEPKELKTVAGPMMVFRPQLRAAEESFKSSLAEGLGNGSKDLQRLVSLMYIGGLSTRDVEGLFRDSYGEVMISKSTVSRMTTELNRDFEAWRNRDLSGLDVVYLFLDGVYLAVRQGTDEKEGVLCAYGVLRDGKKVLLHLALGSRESYEGWLGFLEDMVERGLGEPLLTVFDGNPGLKKAIREVFPNAHRQRCQVHKMRNILCKLPRGVLKEMKRLIQRVFLAPSYEVGLRLGRALINRFKGRYSAAMECLEKDLEECLTYLKFPREHWRSIRTTNLLERTFGEGRRRTKVIPRFPTETAGLKLVYATLVRASERWHGLKITPSVLRQLDAIGRHRIEVEKLAA